MTGPFTSNSLSHSAFTVILFFGIILVFIVPPIQGPDEDSHFVRVVMLSQGRIYPTYENGKLGQDVPQSLRDYVAAHASMRSHPEQKYLYQRWYADSHARSANEPRVHYAFSAQLASPLLYLPQIAGILAGKTFYWLLPSPGFNWAAALYFARLGNLFVFAVGIALALRALPVFRNTVAFIATMPMSVFLSSTVSYDVTVILAAITFFTLVVSRWSSGSAPTRATKICTFIAAFMLGHAKVVYLPLLLTIVLLRHVMPRREFAIHACTVLACGVAGVVAALALFSFTGEAMPAVAFNAQKAYLLAHPFAIPLLVWHSLIARSDFYIISFFGNFGSLDTNLPLPAIMLLFALMLASIFADSLQLGKRILQPYDHLIIFVGCAASVTLTMLALYILWTSQKPGGIGARLVDGVQGRYFIPMAPYFFSLFAIMPAAVGRRLTWVRTAFPQFQMTAAAAMLTLACFAVLARYWIPNP